MSVIFHLPARLVVIVLLDPTSDRCSRFFLVPVQHLVAFLFFRGGGGVPSLVAVAFRVMIRRPPMGEMEPPEPFQEPRRSELRSIVVVSVALRCTAALGQPCQDGLLYRSQCVFGSGSGGGDFS